MVVVMVVLVVMVAVIDKESQCDFGRWLECRLVLDIH